MSEKMMMHFAVAGEFITNAAREKLYVDKDLDSAIRVLRSSLVTDELDSDEQLMLCLQVLHGAASIVGRSDTPEYRLVFRDDIDERPTNLSAIGQLIKDMEEENRKLQEKNMKLMDKLAFMAGELSPYKLEDINADYYNATGEPMFADMTIPSWRKVKNQLGMSDMLESFMAQRRRMEEVEDEDGEPVCDYGWLEPDGTWHPVEWGMHAKWAGEWLEEHMPFKEHPEIYWRIDKDGRKHHITGGDVLVFSLGWILMDSPWQGLAKSTMSPEKAITKAQKEFLYDYFMERKRNEEANALYED